ncbi:MAG: hypothetical protein KDK48_00820, partial [Chlamydiia bacterium]|nr:hypothetical protein [Chlamydiia bacterium]
PAFTTLVKKFDDEKRPLRIFLRTFGDDLALAVKTFNSNFPNRSIDVQGHFSGRTLRVGDTTYDTIEKVYSFFLSCTGDVAIQEDPNLGITQGQLFPYGKERSYFFCGHSVNDAVCPMKVDTDEFVEPAHLLGVTVIHVDERDPHQLTNLLTN